MKIDLSLPPPPPANNIINDLISNTLQKLLKLIMIKPTQYLSPIQVIYHFENCTIPQSLLSTTNH